MTCFAFFPDVDGVREYTDRVIEAMGVRFDRSLVRLSVSEALLNAIVHGTLGVDPGQGERDPVDFENKIRAATRALEPSATVEVEVLVGPDEGEAEVVIRDRGLGFDWRTKLSAQTSNDEDLDALLRVGGRGIGLMLAGAKSLTWNEVGNELRLRFVPTK